MCRVSKCLLTFSEVTGRPGGWLCRAAWASQPVSDLLSDVVVARAIREANL